MDTDSTRAGGDLASTSSSATSTARILYLDMNVWVTMTRGCRTGTKGWLNIRDELIRATQEDQLIVPLSPAHYLELWHRRDSESRRHVAEVMRDVSGYSALASPDVLQPMEARGLVAAWSANTAVRMPTAADIIGRGAAHAFGRPFGRFRFVETIASPDGKIPEGPAVEPPTDWMHFRNAPGWEWFQLFGIEVEIPEELNFDRTPEHRIGSAKCAHELNIRDWLKSHTKNRTRLQQLVICEEFEAIREYIEDGCIQSRTLPPPALRAGNWGPQSAQALRDLVRSIPSADTRATLRYLKHRDTNLAWEQHDWTDIWSLSVAIPYCDAVVTEKRWAHLAAAGGLSNRYKTAIGHGLQAIKTVVENL